MMHSDMWKWNRRTVIWKTIWVMPSNGIKAFYDVSMIYDGNMIPWQDYKGGQYKSVLVSEYACL